MLKLDFGQKFGDIVYNFPDGVDIVDRDYRIRFQNRLLEDRFGDSKGKLCYEVYLNRDAPCPDCPMRKAIKNGRTKRSEIVGADGRHYELTSTPIRNPDGTVSALEVVRDVTEYKKMEAAVRGCSEQLEAKIAERARELREGDAPYVTLVENARDCALVARRDGFILVANDAAVALLEYSRDELVGHINKNLVPQMLGSYECKIKIKHGKTVPVESNAVPIKYAGKPAFLIIIHDLTERKQLEARLLEAKRLKYISKLATMVGHDLRNPLTAINLTGYNIRKSLGKVIDGNVQKMFDIIERNVSYADKIVRDLSDLAADRPLKLHEVDINSLVEEALSKPMLKNVETVTELATIPPALVDREYVKRAFFNIILNAVQSMPDGGTLTVTTKEREGFVDVSFKDTGVGIPRGNIQKIFDPLFTTKAKGQGLGLSTAKRIVEIQGGTIIVESGKGGGSTFTVRLPINSTNLELDWVPEA